jgi:Protein of unknown function (DUF2630)
MDEKPKEITDQQVLAYIEKLVAEEHELYNKGMREEEERARLAKIQVELDQCWDLLRQRRARRGGRRRKPRSRTQTGLVGASGFEPECGQARVRASPNAGGPECGRATDLLVYPQSGPEPITSIP